MAFPRLLLVALGLHELAAFYPQLHFPGEGVYDIVNAGVAGLPAAEEGAVGGVDDGVAAQGGDIPLPEHQTGVGGRRRGENLPSVIPLSRIISPRYSSWMSRNSGEAG